MRAIQGSVRRKTMAIALATTVVALLINAVALLAYEVRTLRETYLADLQTQAEILGRASAAAIAFKDQKGAVEGLSMLRARPDIEIAALYTADGSLFASYPNKDSSDIPLTVGVPGAQVDGVRVSTFYPIIEQGEMLGSVYLRARTGLKDRVLGYLGILSAVMTVALVVAWLLSAWLQRAVTQPLEAVATAARAVFEKRDFSVRAPKTTEDEIGTLADALNQMLADLEREMAERRGAEDALKAADRRKDEFLATLAHELRNPLAPIRNAAYIMQASKNDPAAITDGLAMIERQLNQMVRLVDDLLDVSRITTGKLTLRRERTDVRAVAQSALETIEPLIRARGHRLSVELPPDGMIIHADPTRLAQVFLNLLNNAAKFTDPGGCIDFHVQVRDGELTVRVRDNGIGIAPEMIDELFEMFAQADHSLERSATGLGVGLSLARRLVELHGGTIEAYSDGHGHGSEFVVRIPLSNIDMPVERRGGEAAAATANGARHRILLADDNIDFATSLAMVLGSMGNDVRVEHDGPAAFAAATEFRPDIAFLDIGLPRLNGYDLARRLRKLPVTADCILVAVTGWGQASDRQLAREAGFDDYMVKPVDMQRIQAMLHSA